MGLLDSLLSGSQGGYGGLLDALMYQSPLTAPPPPKPSSYATPSFGPNGEFDPSVITQAASPFGPPPQIAPQQPQSVFASGAAPLTAGFDPSLLTSQQQPQAQPQVPAMQPPQTIAPQAPPPQAPQNSPINSMNIGGYQMPQFGSAADYTPQPQTAPTDVSAQSRAPAMQSLPPALQERSILSRIGSPDGLIARLTGNDTRSLSQQNLRATFDATRQVLRQSGMSDQEATSKAMLAALNPEAAKTIIPEALSNKEKYGVVSDNPIEGKKYGFINERDQTINGKALGEGGSDGQSMGMLAPGVKFDSSKSGEDYINQFSPEVKAAAKAWLNGDVMPTGNPRQQGITTLAKTVAQKYANDLGIPASDAIYGAKRKMQTDLAASGNSSMGGILSNGKSSFKHLAEYTDSAADLGNASYNVPLGGIAAHTQNFIGNTLGGSNTQGKIKAISDNLGHYGQESTKFYAASGGGVEERTNALKQMNPATNSGEEVAAYAEKEKNLMLDRFREKEAQVRDVMGDKYLQDHPVFSDELKRDIARIDANVARLRGESRPTGNTTKSGVNWSIVK